MAKELSELLADLSNESKKVEDAFAAIADETDAKAAERRDRVQADAAAAVARLDAGVTSAEASITGHWHALQERIGAQVDDIKTGIAERQHARDVDHAERDAAAAEERAERAVAFAAAAVQTAGLAVMDAAVARREAAAVKRG